MTKFPMRRIKLWAEKTGREIHQRDGKFAMTGKGVKYKLVYRPKFREICSAIMMKEGCY